MKETKGQCKLKKLLSNLPGPAAAGFASCEERNSDHRFVEVRIPLLDIISSFLRASKCAVLQLQQAKIQNRKGGNRTQHKKEKQ